MVDYVADIESDLSVFHRVDDANALTIARYLALAPRLAAYQGALRARLATPESGTSAGTPSVRGVPLAADGAGDTPPEVVAQLKRAALGARYGVDPAAIQTVSTDVLLKELGV